MTSDELPDEVTVTMKAGDAAIALPGHERRECEVCSEQVIVNPATVKSIDRGVYPDYIICLECAHKHQDE